MSAREFSKISPAMWRSARFAGLSDKGKIAFVYFCTNAHVTSAGCYVLPDGYACSDLGWDQATYDAIRSEVVAAGMLDFDPDHSVVFVERWFKHNPLMNEKHATGTTRFLAQIESDRLKEKALAALSEADSARLAKQAEKDAERAARQSATVAKLGAMGLETDRSSNRLLATPLMQRGAV